MLRWGLGTVLIQDMETGNEIADEDERLCSFVYIDCIRRREYSFGRERERD